MHTRNSLVMRADVETIYGLAAAVEAWPTILPHYRWVRVLEEGTRERIVEMAARRGRIPLWWRAVQTLDPQTPRIAYRHIQGVTTGMEVAWQFTPGAAGVAVSISHELSLGWPLIGGLVADRIIGPHFVAAVAGQTLRHIGQIAEHQARLRAGDARLMGELGTAPLEPPREEP